MRNKKDSSREKRGTAPPVDFMCVDVWLREAEYKSRASISVFFPVRKFRRIFFSKETGIRVPLKSTPVFDFR
jgi:hypothetical protein